MADITLCSMLVGKKAPVSSLVASKQTQPQRLPADVGHHCKIEAEDEFIKTLLVTLHC